MEISAPGPEGVILLRPGGVLSELCDPSVDVFLQPDGWLFRMPRNLETKLFSILPSHAADEAMIHLLANASMAQPVPDV